jgi:hypothetical protein
MALLSPSCKHALLPQITHGPYEANIEFQVYLTWIKSPFLSCIHHGPVATPKRKGFRVKKKHSWYKQLPNIRTLLLPFVIYPTIHIMKLDATKFTRKKMSFIQKQTTFFHWKKPYTLNTLFIYGTHSMMPYAWPHTWRPVTSMPIMPFRVNVRS